MKTFTRIIPVAFAAAFLIACSPANKDAATTAPAPAPAAATGASGASGGSAVKQYPMHGKIVSLDATKKTAKIDAGPIGDWMGAMTMNYDIKDPAEFAKLTVGETFDATVFVDGDNDWVANIAPSK